MARPRSIDAWAIGMRHGQLLGVGPGRRRRTQLLKFVGLDVGIRHGVRVFQQAVGASGQFAEQAASAARALGVQKATEQARAAAFGAVPDGWSWLGMAIIGVCGATSAWLNVRAAAERHRPVSAVQVDTTAD